MNLKGTSKNSLLMLNQRDFADSKEVKPKHTLLYGKALLTVKNGTSKQAILHKSCRKAEPLFGNKIAIQRGIGIFRGALKAFFNRGALMAALLPLLLYLSCAVINSERLDFSISPDKSGLVLPRNSGFHIYFNEEVDRDSAQEATRIKQRGNTIALDFSWNGNTLTARPVQDLEPGFIYFFTVTGSIKDIYGNSFSFDRNITFQVQGNFDLPHLLSRQPADDQLTGARDPLILNFSESMDTDSVKDAFTLSGNQDFDLVWNDEQTSLTVSPLKRWTQPAVYRWELPDAETRSAAGQLIRQSYQGYFRVGQDLQKPQVQSLTPADCHTFTPIPGIFASSSAIASDACLLINWSEDMAEEPSLKALRFDPDTTGTWLVLTPARYLFQPSTPWKPVKEYILLAETKARDISGNPLDEEYRKKFSVQSSAIVQIRSITGSNNASFDWTASGYTQINTVFDVQNLEETYGFTIELSQAYSDAYKQRIVDALSLQAIFPGHLRQPGRKNLYWNNNSTLTINFTGFERSSDVAPISTKYYQLEISSGKDTANENGNYLTEDITLHLRTAP